MQFVAYVVSASQRQKVSSYPDTFFLGTSFSAPLNKLATVRIPDWVKLALEGQGKHNAKKKKNPFCQKSNTLYA